VDTAQANSLGAKLLGDGWRREHEREQERERYFTAIHEASHAVADIQFGHPINFVSIEYNKGSLGRVEVAEHESLLWQELMALAAGAVGEAKAREMLQVDQTGNKDDHKKMEDFCRNDGLSPEETQSACARAYAAAMVFFAVDSMWAAVREIADLLTKQTRIEGAAVHEIVAKYYAPSCGQIDCEGTGPERFHLEFGAPSPSSKET
jgi:hypothetical protein